MAVRLAEDGSAARGEERSAGAIATADEQVQWTCESDERGREPASGGAPACFAPQCNISQGLWTPALHRIRLAGSKLGRAHDANHFQPDS